LEKRLLLRPPSLLIGTVGLGVALAEASEYVIDGDNVNKLLDAYQLDAHMLPGQVFDIIEKKLIKTLMDDIDKARPQTIRFVNLEAIPSGPHGAFFHAICGGLSELIELLINKKIAVTGTIRNPRVLPWNLVSKIDRDFKGVAATGTATT
jgi:hypothetical protein